MPRARRRPRGTDGTTLTAGPPRRALACHARGPLPRRRQLFIGPVGSRTRPSWRPVLPPSEDGRGPHLGDTHRVARRPVARSTGHSTGMRLLQPQPYRGAMAPAILGHRLTLPSSTRHPDGLTPVMQASGIGGVAELFPGRWFWGRPSEPPHRFPPPLSCKILPRRYRKKDARAGAACIRRRGRGPETISAASRYATVRLSFLTIRPLDS